MQSLRFVLILFLTVALDLASPIPSSLTSEAAEALEEATHVRPGHRSFRLVRDTVAPKVAHETRTVELQRPRLSRPAPSHAAPTVVLARKLPPSLHDSASAPEDH